MNVTSPTITQFINALESKGLVERVMDVQDRRAVRVQLTEEGHRVVQETYQNVKNNFNELVDFLGEEDSVKLTELLTKVYHFHEQNAKRMKRHQTTSRGGGFVKTVSLHETVPDRGHFVLLFTFFQCLSDLYLPTLMADIVDYGIVEGDVPYIWRVGGFMLW